MAELWIKKSPSPSSHQRICHQKLIKIKYLNQEKRVVKLEGFRKKGNPILIPEMETFSVVWSGFQSVLKLMSIMFEVETIHWRFLTWCRPRHDYCSSNFETCLWKITLINLGERSFLKQLKAVLAQSLVTDFGSSVQVRFWAAVCKKYRSQPLLMCVTAANISDHLSYVN